jgi:hypothetical protein
MYGYRKQKIDGFLFSIDINRVYLNEIYSNTIPFQ